MVEGDVDNSTSPTLVSRTIQSWSNVTQELLKAMIKPQSQLITIQLDETNYLLWKFQIKTTINGYAAEEYVLKTLITPSKYIVDNEGRQVSNKDYITHQRQDNLIRCW